MLAWPKSTTYVSSHRAALPWWGRVLAVMPANPYKTLGVSPRSSRTEVKQQYHALVRRYHPDRLTDKGLSALQLAQAERQVAAFNAAYEQVTRRRGWK